jgi:hypothetical protein
VAQFDRDRHLDGETLQVLIFGHCHTLSGCSEQVHVGRRNGRTSLFLGEADADISGRQRGQSRGYIGLLRDVYRNLTPLQRWTWHRLLNGASVLSISKERGTSRSAVYDTIHRMVERNGFCKRWWRRRDMANQYG